MRAVLASFLVLSAVGCDALIGRIVDRAVQAQRGAGRADWLDDGALHVVLCGTGAPLPDRDRAAACTAVIAAGRVFVVDVGPGSQEVAQLVGVPTGALEGVLLTHFHSDHIGELGEWAMQSWAAGRRAPLDVYGPEGVDAVVAGFQKAYAFDDGYRIAHHGEDVMPSSATRWIPHEVPVVVASETVSAPVFYERDGLVVKVFAVDHSPVSPAVGYRFEYGGRAVVVGGDTDVSASLEAASRGADLIVHEALLKSLIGQVAEALGEADDERRRKLASDIIEYHTSPAEAAAIAQAAGVDTLVLTHLVPPLPRALRRWLYLRDVDAGDVDVIVGEDGLHFRLPAGEKTIERESLF